MVRPGWVWLQSLHLRNYTTTPTSVLPETTPTAGATLPGFLSGLGLGSQYCDWPQRRTGPRRPSRASLTLEKKAWLLCAPQPSYSQASLWDTIVWQPSALNVTGKNQEWFLLIFAVWAFRSWKETLLGAVWRNSEGWWGGDESTERILVRQTETCGGEGSQKRGGCSPGVVLHCWLQTFYIEVPWEPQVHPSCTQASLIQN